MRRFVFTLLIVLTFSNLIYSQHSNWSSLKPGKHKVGFKTILQKGRDGKSFLISLWYPASSGGSQMRLADLIRAEKSLGDSDTTLIKDFKSVVRRIYDLETLDEVAFQNSIDQKTNTFHDAAMTNGRFPLIIAFADPASYFVSFEFLASHGFIIASATSHFDEPPPPPRHYEPFVNLLEDLFQFMIKQPYVDTFNISAFGHGGGIQSAIYLAMRNNSIKSVINLDGGFFGPRSNTVAAIDYHPERFKIPLLHIITVSQAKQDDPQQVAAIKSPITRIRIKSDSIWHHDFTSFGAVALYGLKIRQPPNFIESDLRSINEMMLDFLQGHKISAKQEDLFVIENLN